MGAIEKTVNAIVEKVGPQCQLVVICGRNKKLVDKLQSRCGPLKLIQYNMETHKRIRVTELIR